ADRGSEAHGVAQRLAEVLLVVIAGQGEDGAAALEEVGERLLQVADGVAQGLGAGQLAEQVAGHQQQVDRLGSAVAGDALDGAAQILRAVDPPEAVGQVPVSGVQDTHDLPPSMRGYCRQRTLSHRPGDGGKPSRARYTYS